VVQLQRRIPSQGERSGDPTDPVITTYKGDSF
jgi:hypothetical protein